MAVALAPNARWDWSSTGAEIPFTWCSWVRPDALPADFAGLFYTGGVNNTHFVAVFIHQSTGALSVWDDSFTLRAATDAVAMGEWLFLGVSVSAAGNITLVWRSEDDHELSSSVGTLAGNDPVDDFLYLGSNRNAPDFNFTFEGAFQHSRMFRSVLSEAQMLAESRSSTAVGPAWADWPLTDETSGTDATAHGHHLTLDAGTGSASLTDGPALPPSALPPQFLELPTDVRVELAFGADLTAPPSSWSWTDVFSDVHSQSLTIKRGQEDESAQGSPASVSFELDNPHGNYTPGLVTSAHYPHVRRNTPCRLWVPGGETAMLVQGNGGASTPDRAAFGVTDIDVAAEISVERDVGEIRTVAAQYVVAGDQRGWWLRVDPGRQMALQWTVDGLLATAASRVSPPLPAEMRRLWVRVQLDTDNGSGGNTVTWLVSSDGVSWEPLGAPETQAGTTSVFDSAAPLEVGSVNGQTRPFTGGGRLHRLRWLDGIDGSAVADPDFTEQAPGTVVFGDSAGNTWDLLGAAEISTRRIWLSGQVARWELSWPYRDLSDHDDPEGRPGESRVSVEVSGITRRLGQRNKPLSSALTRMIGAPINEDGVIAHWPGEDGSDANVISSPIPGVQPMGFGGEITLASDDSLAASDALPNVSGGQPAGWGGAVPGGSALTNWAHDLFVHIPTAGSSSWPVTVVNAAAGRVRRWQLSVNSTVVTINGSDSEGATVVNTTFGSNPLFFGGWALVHLRLVQSGANTNWQVAWVPIPGGVAFGTSGSYSGAPGRPTFVGNLFVSSPPDGVSVGQWIISTNRVLGWLAPADTAFVGEPATTRERRLCQEQGVPVSVLGPVGDDWATVTGQGVAAMGPQRPVGFLEILQECVDADFGMMWEDLDSPGLVFRSGADLTNQEPSVGLDALRAGDIDNPLTPVLDDQRIRNDVTAARVDGSSHREVDQVSIVAEDHYDEEVTVNVATDQQLPDQAGWRLHLGTWSGMRYPSVSSDLTIAHPETLEAWLAADLGDLVTISGLPPQHPPDPVGLILRGVTATLDPGRFTIEANATPAGPWTVGVRDDDQLGKRDTAGSATTHDFASGTDTGLDVFTTLGPLWTTDPAEFPFDLNVGGVRLTVTAVGAAPTSSPAAGDGQQSLATSTTHTAPPVVAQGSTDLLVCAWCSWEGSISSYTAPGGMGDEAVTGSGVWSDMLSATEQLAASGSTGNRTATYGSADRWSALSVVVRGDPLVAIEEALSGYGSGQDVTLETSPGTEAGWWLLAIQGWDHDPTRIQRQPRGPIPPAGTGLPPDADRWVRLAASGPGGEATSRISAWVRLVTRSGRQPVTFAHNNQATSPPADNHCRLFVLSGVLAGQPFTVDAAPVNGVEKTIPAGSPVVLWQPAVRAL